jgi:succinate dehydrogenase / fumarate reductase cytochrome b subunit
MKSTSMAAHVIQRISGVLLLIYLFLHVLTVHKLAAGPEAFNAALATYHNPVFKLLEIALLGTVIVHALNGVRITLLDLGLAQGERRLFWVLAVGVGAAVFLLGAIPLFLHAVLKV